MINREVPPVSNNEQLPRYTEEELGKLRNDVWTQVNEDATFIGGKEFDGSADISGVWSFADDISVGEDLYVAGDVQFGAHQAIAAEAVTGYITIKDSAGNSRKLAVVS